ncbi:MAG: cohesin domain-containing protein, partial [Bacteroidota bacterium]
MDWDLTPGLCEYANQFGQVISNSTWSFGTISCNSNPINVSLGSANGCNGDTLSIPVSILNANNIGAISLALNYNPNSTTFLDVTGIDPLISTLIASTNNFGGFNQIRASWAEVTPVNLNGIAFYIRVIVNNNDNLSFDLTNTGNTEISDPLGNPYTNVTYAGTNTSVTASTTNTTNATACSTYIWSANNQSYSASGTYTFRSGCHQEILNLTISAQPPAPTGLACYETASFNTTSCSWVVSGTQPPAPTGLACYETATFNTTSCSWVISGTPSPTIVTNISACNSFLWPINGLTYSSGGVYNFSQNCQDYRLILTINPSYNINVTLPLFFGSTFNFNGQTITSAGTYSSTFQSIYGC